MINVTESFWQAFARQTSGVYRKPEYWYLEGVELEHRRYTIVLEHYNLYASGDNYHAVMTRVTVPFVSLNNFRFDITRTGILNSLAVFFGAQDIRTGYKEFDAEFVIKASRNDLMLHLLKNVALRQCLEKQPEVNFLIGNRRGIWGDELPKGHLEMGYFIDGACEDMKRMLSIYELVCLWLDALIETKTIERISAG